MKLTKRQKEILKEAREHANFLLEDMNAVEEWGEKNQDKIKHYIYLFAKFIQDKRKDLVEELPNFIYDFQNMINGEPNYIVGWNQKSSERKDFRVMIDLLIKNYDKKD